jgi:hypothetical protein
MDEEERSIQVRKYYQTLGQGVREFDGSLAALVWNTLIEDRDQACIDAAARIIQVYTDMGSYPASGEEFHQLAEFMASLRWLSWGGVDELEEFLAANRPAIERRVRKLHAESVEDPMYMRLREGMRRGE